MGVEEGLEVGLEVGLVTGEGEEGVGVGEDWRRGLRVGGCAHFGRAEIRAAGGGVVGCWYRWYVVGWGG